MFDDHPSTVSGNIPPNLPLGEPTDIFGATDDVSNIPSIPQSPPGSISTALDAGILKPKAPVIETQPMLGTENIIKEPTTSRGLMVIILSVIVGSILVGGGWYAYGFFTKNTDNIPVIVPIADPTPSIPVKDPTPDPVPEPVIPEASTSSLGIATSTTSSDALDQEILFGGDKDSDGDGIKDAVEKELRTDPTKADTDMDGLSDGEEFLIWHTNPQNPDTDGDTYKDGQEIKSGYNPNGAGKLTFTPPTTTLSNLATSTKVNTAPTSVSKPQTATAKSTSSFQIEL